MFVYKLSSNNIEIKCSINIIIITAPAAD